MDSGLKTVHQINIQRSLDISLLGSLATDQPVTNKKFAFLAQKRKTKWNKNKAKLIRNLREHSIEI